jgi:fructosamine-3-kinase
MRARVQALEHAVEERGAAKEEPAPHFSRKVAGKKKKKSSRATAEGVKRSAASRKAPKHVAAQANGSNQGSVPTQLELTAADAAEARKLGKRQALGKSLLQLRKSSTRGPH